MGAFASLSQAAVRRGQSSGASLPERSRCDSTFASLHMSRCVTSAFDISSVNNATGTWWRIAMLAPMQSPNADFPMLGRRSEEHTSELQSHRDLHSFPTRRSSDLRLRHLEREQRDGNLVADRDVGADAEPERRLPHARAGGDDHEVPGLEARGQPVDLAKPRRNPRDLLAGLVERSDALEALLEQRFDVGELRRDPALREFEDDLLGAVDEVGGLAHPLPAQRGDLAAHPDEAAEGGHLADDPRVVAGVRAGGYDRGELVDAAPTARALELSALLELVDERDRVDGLASGVQCE